MMYRYFILLLGLALMVPEIVKAQQPSDFLPDKSGKWSYSNNVTSTDAEYIAFSKVVASLAGWFHLNMPMLLNPKGFDLAATTYGQWDKYYKMNKCNYGLRTEMNFSFQLFYSAEVNGLLNRRIILLILIILKQGMEQIPIIPFLMNFRMIRGWKKP